MGIKEKISERLDSIQLMMESNTHLTRPEEVTEVVDSVSKFWSALKQEERDFINAVRDAIEDGTQWS